MFLIGDRMTTLCNVFGRLSSHTCFCLGWSWSCSIIGRFQRKTDLMLDDDSAVWSYFGLIEVTIDWLKLLWADISYFGLKLPLDWYRLLRADWGFLWIDTGYLGLKLLWVDWSYFGLIEVHLDCFCMAQFLGQRKVWDGISLGLVPWIIRITRSEGNWKRGYNSHTWTNKSDNCFGIYWFTMTFKN